MEKLTVNGNIEIDGNTYTKADLVNLGRLQFQLLKEENIVATLQECINIWGRYSDDLSASWLFFPDKDESILNAIKNSDHFTTLKEYSL